MTTPAEETYQGPSQAEAEANQAIELHGQLFPVDPDEAIVPPAEPAPVAAEPVEPVEPAVADTPAEPAPATPDAPAEPEVIDWQARAEKAEAQYNTLRGKYDAEVPRLHSDLKEFKEQVFNRIGDPTAAPVTPVEEPTAEETARNERIAQFKEEYGEEYVGLLRDFMLSEVKPLLGTAVEPVQEQVASVEEAQQVAATTAFVQYLDENITDINWKEAWEGKDPEFLAFLETPDPSGYYTYGQLAELANENWDGQRIVKIFESYKQSKGIEPTVTPEVPAVPATEPVAPQAAQPPVAPETPAATAPVPPATPAAQVPNPADALVAPSRTTPHTTPATDGNPIIWDSASMAAFEKADQQGKYTPEQSKALWDDLLLAPSQNRFRM